MKMVLVGEDHRNGLPVDWPTVPRAGELVEFRSRGGTTAQKVTSVSYECDEHGNLTEVTVHLTY